MIQFEMKFEINFVKLNLKSNRIQDTSMQIFVLTLTCGIITLDVKASDTIKLVRKKIGIKIDNMFTLKDETGVPVGSFDTEFLESSEGNQGLEFAGKLLEDGRTLSDYKIKSDNTIHVTSKLAGEGTYIHLQFIIILIQLILN